MNWPMYFGINGSSQWQINAGDFMPTIDAAMNFGAPASRIANSYFSVSPTVTSDIRLKFYRADPAPTADEHAAALECFEVFGFRSEEHTSELQSLMRISYAVFCLKQKNNQQQEYQ